MCWSVVAVGGQDVASHHKTNTHGCFNLLTFPWLIDSFLFVRKIRFPVCDGDFGLHHKEEMVVY